MSQHQRFKALHQCLSAFSYTYHLTCAHMHGTCKFWKEFRTALQIKCLNMGIRCSQLTCCGETMLYSSATDYIHSGHVDQQCTGRDLGFNISPSHLSPSWHNPKPTAFLFLKQHHVFIAAEERNSHSQQYQPSAAFNRNTKPA